MGQANQRGTKEERVFNALSRIKETNKSYKDKIPKIVLDNIIIREDKTGTRVDIKKPTKSYPIDLEIAKKPKLYNAYSQCDSCKNETYYVHDIKTVDSFNDDFDITIGICESCGFKSFLKQVPNKILPEEMKRHNDFLKKLESLPNIIQTLDLSRRR